jgi:hypothetical protein
MPSAFSIYPEIQVLIVFSAQLPKKMQATQSASPRFLCFVLTFAAVLVWLCVRSDKKVKEEYALAGKK